MFQLESSYAPAGDQPQAIAQLTGGLLAGAQHQVQVLDANSRNRLDWYRAGTSGTLFNGDQVTYHSGGDMQVIEAIDGFVIAGCHCIRQSYGTVDLTKLLYWSGANKFSSHSSAIAFDPVTRRPLDFIPALTGTYWGTWAIGSDTNGCLYIGGDYRGAQSGLVLGGFGRFCTPTSAPQGLSAASGRTTANLTWREPEFAGSGVDRYRVSRDGVVLGETAGLTYGVTGLTANQPTTLAVSVVSTDGKVGPPASLAIVPGSDTSPPSAPATLALSTNAIDQVTLNWAGSTDNVGVTGYLVHRDYQFLAWVPSGTTYADRSVAAGGSYRYEVRAQDAVGNVSPPSPARSIAVRSLDVTPPTPPSGLVAATDGLDVVTLTWSAATDNVGVTGYLLHRDGRFVAWVPIGTTYADRNVVPGATYRYEVRAQDAAGNNSTATVPVAITIVAGGADTTPPTVPLAPTGRYDSRSRSVVLSWGASTDSDRVGGYLIHRDGQFLAWVSPSLSFTDTTAAAGAHRYEVRAQDPSGNNSSPTAAITVVVP